MVCDEWRNDFEAFLADMQPTWRPGLVLDRLDNDGPYSKENCKWRTMKEQQRNRRNNHMIDTPRGRMCMAEAVEVSGLSWWVLQTRARRGVAIKHMFDPHVPRSWTEYGRMGEPQAIKNGVRCRGASYGCKTESNTPYARHGSCPALGPMRDRGSPYPEIILWFSCPTLAVAKHA